MPEIKEESEADRAYYVRVSFERGDGRRGCPISPPAMEESDLEAFRPFFYPTAAAALQSYLDEEAQDKVEICERIHEPFGIVPPHEEPLPYGEYICRCVIDHGENELDLIRRVYFIDTIDRCVVPLSFDEDFLITWQRDYIFDTWETEDPKMRSPTM